MKYPCMTTVASVLALLCFSTAFAQTPKTNTAKKKPASPKVLGVFEAGRFQYQLAVAPCVNKEGPECPVVVNLLQGGKQVDKQKLKWFAATQKFKPKPPEEGKASPGKAWAAVAEGCEDCDEIGESCYKIEAQLTPLDAKHSGLFLTQTCGMEHVVSLYELYTVINGKLKKVWSHFPSSIGAPMGTSVFPVVIEKRLALLLWESDWYEHKLEARLLRWQADKKKMVSMKLPTKAFPLHLVAFGFYSEVDLANNAKSQIECVKAAKDNAKDAEPADAEPAEGNGEGFRLWKLQVLETEHLPQLKRPEKALLGNLFFTRKEAEEFQQELKACLPTREAEIILLN